jgi:hypothetical protein
LKNLPGKRNKVDEERAYLDVCHRTMRVRSDVELILADEHFFDAASRPSAANVWKEIRDTVWKGTFGDITGASIMSALRDHLAELQGDDCCYCRQALLLGGYSRPLDHVLPASVYGRFSFHFWNLAVACERCNRIKKDKGFQPISRSKRHYPEHGSFVDYYHPRLHPFEQHVRFGEISTAEYRYIFYVGLTKQGKQLVNDVLRDAALELTRESNDSVVKAAAEKIRLATAMQGLKARAAIQRFEQSIRHAVEAGAASV